MGLHFQEESLLGKFACLFVGFVVIIDLMRDPGEIYTKDGTPMILQVSRVLFAGLFLFMLWALKSDKFFYSKLHFVWILYVFLIYLLAEKMHAMFFAQGIDLTFAFPILLAIYGLNVISVLLGGQERLPLLNRAEHFTSFILITYIVWIFFIRFLPQEVWVEHPYYTALLVMAVTSLIGVTNELAELLMESLFNTHFVGEKPDTSLDLLMNTLGSGLFLSVRLILGLAGKTVKRVA